ncbi:MAG: PAS domain-containing protein [Armatimonadota bacterium]
MGTTVQESGREQEEWPALGGVRDQAAQILESITDAFFAVDRDWRFTYVNRQAETLLARSRGYLLGKCIWEEYSPLKQTEVHDLYQQAMHARTTASFETYYEPHRRWYEVRVFPAEAGISVYFRDVTPRKRSEALLRGQKRVLEGLVKGVPLPDLLAEICRVMEAQGEGLHTSVLLLDADGKHLRHGAGPSLPAAYNGAIDGIATGPEVGSCGTAAFTGKTVVVSDIATDPLWASFRELALGFGLRACWSTPILSEKQEVLGTFAIYHQEPHEPGQDERAVAEVLARTTAVAIEWHRAGSRLARATEAAARHERLLNAIVSSTPDLVYVFGRDHRFQYANQALLDMWGRTWDEAIGKNCLELGYEPWHAEMHDWEIEEVIATRQPVRGEVPFHGTQGRRIYDYILVPVLDQHGDVEMVAGTTRDVTERKEYEEAERSAREAAERERTAALGLADELRLEREKLERANQDLYARTQELRVQQERLQSLTRYLRSATRCAAQIASLDAPEAICQTVVDTLVGQFAAVAAGIWLCSPRPGWLHLSAAAGFPDAPVYGLEPQVEVVLSASKLGWVARARRPFITNELSGELQLDQEWLRRERLTAGAFVPILGPDRLHGVLTVFASEPLPLEVGEVLTTIAASISTRLDYLALANEVKPNGGE